MNTFLKLDELKKIAGNLFGQFYQKEDFSPQMLEYLLCTSESCPDKQKHLVEFGYCLKDRTFFTLFSVQIDRKTGIHEIVVKRNVNDIPQYEKLNHEDLCLN
jgi:hypothetical protein